jgi:serine kinase of HPr protein (carbohydrate metabolism regulator)
MTSLSSETLHATCVAIGDQAVLISGPSGSGKSDLALRLIDRGAVLVSDDYTIVQRQSGTLIASAPATILGKIEVYGIGIIETETVQNVPIALIVTLDEPIVRMPVDAMTRNIAGIALPVLSVLAHEASTPIKIEIAVKSWRNQQG